MFQQSLSAKSFQVRVTSPGQRLVPEWPRSPGDKGIKIGSENMPLRHSLGRKANIYWLNDPQALGQIPHLTLDTTHIGTWGHELLTIYEQAKTRIIHMHLSNFYGQEHQLPGEGHLPLGKFLRWLALDGY